MRACGSAPKLAVVPVCPASVDTTANPCPSGDGVPPEMLELSEVSRRMPSLPPPPMNRKRPFQRSGRLS